jgi:hypothetical protein
LNLRGGRLRFVLAGWAQIARTHARQGPSVRPESDVSSRASLEYQRSRRGAIEMLNRGFHLIGNARAKSPNNLSYACFGLTMAQIISRSKRSKRN